MDFQALLHQYPQNILIAFVVGMIVMWLIGRSSRRNALEQERARHEADLGKLREEYLAELGAREQDIASLRDQLADADRLSARLSATADQLPGERKRYAELTSRYLNDVSRASSALKSRSMAFIKLQGDHRDANEQLGALRTRHDEERARYAQIVTEKARKVTELESRLEQAIADAEAAAEENTYSRQELEGMLVDLRQQLASRENELANLRDRGEEALPDQLAALRAEIAERDGRISRLQTALESRQQSAPDEDPAALRDALQARERELTALRAEMAQAGPAASRLHTLERRLGAALRDRPEDSPEEVRELEVKLRQLETEMTRVRAEARDELNRQAKAYQRQLNARADTIGRLNRQLQASAGQS